MKGNFSLQLLIGLLVILWSCTSSPEGVTINGDITNSQNLTVFLDKVTINKANEIISKTATTSSGGFTFNFPEGLESGIYNLRIGAKRLTLVIDGQESTIDVSGDLNNIQKFDYQVAGSPDSESFQDLMQKAVARQIQATDIETFVDTVSSPMLGAYVAYKTLGPAGDFIDVQKKAHAKLSAVNPDAVMSTEYFKYINTIEQQYKARMATERIQVGQPAPDIELASPDGKSYNLSDLKGNVVLLDFWASWCGPCRKENPNVVKVYDKYKEQGFTVFSVSLDGLDSKSKARLGADDKIQQMMDRSKQRWVQAIQQDNLKWEYHVSDLRKWESAPAGEYGVRSIPRTFLIDREGKIAAVNLRGAAQIERELQKVL